jgi:DNA-binding MarR family transcriptional regulator
MKHSAYTRLKASLKILREAYPDMSAPMMLVFLEVCQAGREGVTVGQVEKRVGITQSASSRNCRLLTRKFDADREGMDLCEWIPDPNDRRSRVLVLNKHGQEIEKRLEEALA